MTHPDPAKYRECLDSEANLRDWIMRGFPLDTHPNLDKHVSNVLQLCEETQKELSACSASGGAGAPAVPSGEESKFAWTDPRPWKLHWTPAHGISKGVVIMGGQKHCAACGGHAGGYAVPRNGIYEGKILCGRCWRLLKQEMPDTDMSPYNGFETDVWCDACETHHSRYGKNMERVFCPKSGTDVVVGEPDAVDADRSGAGLAQRLREEAHSLLYNTESKSLLLDAARALSQPPAKAPAAYIVTFSSTAWEDGQYVITANGEPVGCTIAANDRNEIVRWVASAWAELIKANEAAAEAARGAGA